MTSQLSYAGEARECSAARRGYECIFERCGRGSWEQLQKSDGERRRGWEHQHAEKAKNLVQLPVDCQLEKRFVRPEMHCEGAKEPFIKIVLGLGGRRKRT